MAVGAEDGFIMGAHVTAANHPDCKELMRVVEVSGCEPGTPVLADKGYASAVNRNNLEKAGYFDFIMYKASRNHPLNDAQRQVNKLISRIRGSVERAFGSMKKHYGLGRARYLGVGKVTMQLLLSAMSFILRKAPGKVAG